MPNYLNLITTLNTVHAFMFALLYGHLVHPCIVIPHQRLGGCCFGVVRPTVRASVRPSHLYARSTMSLTVD